MRLSENSRFYVDLVAFVGLLAVFSWLALFGRLTLYCDWGVPVLGLGALGPGLVLAAFAAYRRSWPAAAIALGFLAGGAAVCLSFWTLGEMLYRLLSLLVLAPALPFAAAWAVRPSSANRRRALRVAVLLVLLLVPHQLWLGTRWFLLHREAVRIIDHAESMRAFTGEYPADLDAFDWNHPRYAERVAYGPGGDCARVTYWLVWPGISHWYSQAGGHGYYAD
ncbi:MAG: hypothetical protein AAF604_09295 [Acidobacteriota bacterium]